MKTLKYSLLATIALTLNLGYAQEFNRYSLNIKPLDIKHTERSYLLMLNNESPTINQRLFDLGAKSLQDSIENRASHKWHRFLGYSALIGSIGSAVGGSLVLSKYNNNKIPADGLLYYHRTLGITTSVLCLTNTVLGFTNYNKMKDDDIGLKKRKKHRFFSLISLAGISTAAVFGVMASNDYKNSSSPEDVTTGNTHRIIALSSAGVTIISVGVMMF